MKICTRCGEEKPATLEYFHAYKRSPDGVRSICKVCRSKENAENREERTAKKREFYHKNIDRVRADQRRSYAKHVERRREDARKNHYKNRDRNIDRMKLYLEENRGELNKRRRPKSNKRFNDKYKKDPVFTLTHRVRSLVRRSLKRGVKSDTLNNILDYSMMDLRLHLESKFKDGMSWDEFMKGNIHIDHIIPISHFKPKSTDSHEFKKCWALENLQPLWASDNLSKAGKMS